jgi:TrmH family RNA methyltransferase
VADASQVTSAKSERVTAVRALHARSGRRKAGRFVVEGPQAVRSAVAAGVVVHDLFVDVGTGGSFSDVISAVEASGGRVSWTTAPVMRALSETQQPQGVIAVCPLLGGRDLDASDLEAAMMQDRPIVLLDTVSDPGNVGTIIRTADAAGAAAVVLSPDCADVHNGKVVRSTAGSLFHLPVLPAVAIDRVVASARAHGRSIVVATGDAEVDLFAAAADRRVDQRTVWIIGSEAHGVSEAARTAADLAVAIPMAGRAESLNAAVAAAVALYVTAFTSRFGPASDRMTDDRMTD